MSKSRNNRYFRDFDNEIELQDKRRREEEKRRKKINKRASRDKNLEYDYTLDD